MLRRIPHLSPFVPCMSAHRFRKVFVSHFVGETMAQLTCWLRKQTRKVQSRRLLSQVYHQKYPIYGGSNLYTPILRYVASFHSSKMMILTTSNLKPGQTWQANPDVNRAASVTNDRHDIRTCNAYGLGLAADSWCCNKVNEQETASYRIRIFIVVYLWLWLNQSEK